MKKELILFDNDGVLVETEQWFYQANKEVLESVGIPLPINKYMQIMINGKSALDLLDVKGFSPVEKEELRQKRIIRYQEYLHTKNLKIPNVIKTLKKLKSHYKMAIVTTCMPDDFDIIHQNEEITKFMDKIFTRNDYKKSKPHPEPYQTALDYFGISPERAVVIEDSERGLQSAIAANIDCIIIENQFTKSHNFSKASKILQKFTELPDILIF